MATEALLLENHYLDSVLLMQVAQRLSRKPGVSKAAALTVTEKNRRLLVDFGVDRSLMQSAGPNDLAIALVGEDADTLRAILEHIEVYLEPEQRPATARKARDLRAALANLPEANLAVISVPGEYAGHEGRRSIEAGLNVFLFSSGLSVEKEVELKAAADAKGLIVMGPDCGTALIGGCGLGFANEVRRGSIGVIGSSGTGLQEFTSLIHNAGGGIRHAIGTG